ncbi:MAG: 50S ribosomal protein L22 [Nanoarchaeota archaeon]|nr:50S ribosomal protein L22 [Nanoarchaeota archaeon]
MDKEHTAKALGKDITISTKFSIEIANLIRGKPVSLVKRLLEGIIAKKIAVPMKRFNRDRGHKKGRIAAGRYPNKASVEILKLLKSAEMNAINKGLNEEELYIKLLVINKGSSQWRSGRQRRRRMKRTNIEIVLEEKEQAKKVAPKKEVSASKENEKSASSSKEQKIAPQKIKKENNKESVKKND